MTSPENAQQRIADCDTYHMTFDGVAREFYDHTLAALEVGGVPAIEATFYQVEEEQRKSLLREFLDDLEPQVQLEFIARLTGNAAIKKFLEDIASEKEEYEQQYLLLAAECAERGYFNPELVPADSEVSICLVDTQDLYHDITDDQLAELGYSRKIVLRALGEGKFKVLDENYADGLTYEQDENFDINDIVRIGTGYNEGQGKRREPVVRLKETLAVQRGKKMTHVDAFRNEDEEEISLVVSSVSVDGETYLPRLS